MADQHMTDVYVAVVGVAGAAGKDSLISTCTGKPHPYETSVDACKSRRFLSFILSSPLRNTT